MDGSAILDAASVAIDRDRERRESENAGEALRDAFESLRPREREVMSLVTSGLMNKKVAAELGLSEITVKIHLGNVMRKMNARSLPDLVRTTDGLGLHRPPT